MYNSISKKEMRKKIYDLLVYLSVNGCYTYCHFLEVTFRKYKKSLEEHKFVFYYI